MKFDRTNNPSPPSSKLVVWMLATQRFFIFTRFTLGFGRFPFDGCAYWNERAWKVPTTNDRGDDFFSSKNPWTFRFGFSHGSQRPTKESPQLNRWCRDVRVTGRREVRRTVGGIFFPENTPALGKPIGFSLRQVSSYPYFCGVQRKVRWQGE